MEIEVKLIYKDKKGVVSWLNKSGFRLTKQVEIQDTYFGSGDISMSNKNSLYRIRNLVGQKVEMTLKDSCQDVDGVWSRRELNVTIDNFQNMVDILYSLGCNLIKENFSKREIWTKDKISFEFISFSKPATLKIIEVEGPSQKAVKKVIKELGDRVKVVGEEIFSVFDKKI